MVFINSLNSMFLFFRCGLPWNPNNLCTHCVPEKFDAYCYCVSFE